MPANPSQFQRSHQAANDADWSDRTWVQVSAWARFASQRRELSCMLLGLPDPAVVRDVLPILGDVLSEAGYPWEIVAICASDDIGVTEVMAQLHERPGFRSVTVPANASAATMLTECLRAARGDAVLLLSDRCYADLGLFPASPSRRREFARAIRSSLHECARDCRPGSSVGHGSGGAVAGTADLWGRGVTLLDRSAVDLLLIDR